MHRATIHFSDRPTAKKTGLFIMRMRSRLAQLLTKLIALGYLDFNSRGDEKAEGIAIEAYLGDSL